MNFNFKSVIGQFQKNLIVFGINRKYFASLLTFTTGVSTIYISEILMSTKNGTSFTYSLIITLGSIGLAIYTFIVESLERVKKQNEHLDVTPYGYEENILSNIILDEHHCDSGYDIYEHNGEYYVMSFSINKLLYETAFNISLKMTGSFSLASEVESIVPFAVKKAFDRKSFLFNGKLIRMIDDFTQSGLSNQSCIRIQKTSYFQGLFTNEVVYNRIKNMSTIHDEIFEGYKLSYKHDNEGKYKLLSLKDSYCANYLGGSTLAITKDKYIIITKNPPGADVNSSKMVPSGSGSTDKKDYIIGDTYGSLVTRTMERELREECNLDNNIRMKSIVIGYARLLNRGGKPDFFGLTYVDCKKDAISASRKEIREMGDYSHDFISFSNSGDILMALGEYIEKNDKLISLQLKVTFRILEDFCMKNVDVWSQLITD